MFYATFRPFICIVLQSSIPGMLDAAHGQSLSDWWAIFIRSNNIYLWWELDIANISEYNESVSRIFSRSTLRLVSLYAHVCVCGCMCEGACSRACVYVCVSVCACVSACHDVWMKPSVIVIDLPLTSESSLRSSAAPAADYRSGCILLMCTSRCYEVLHACTCCWCMGPPPLALPPGICLYDVLQNNLYHVCFSPTCSQTCMTSLLEYSN